MPNQPEHGRSWARRTLSVAAAILTGPAILCLAVWFAGRTLTTPTPDKARVVEIIPDDEAAVITAVQDLILVDNTLPADLPGEILSSARQTVPLKTVFNAAETRFGTGFIYAPGVVVTAAHLLDAPDANDLTGILVYCDGRNVPAEIRELDAIRDVAVLDADCDGSKLVLAAGAPPTGNRLYVTGFTYGDQQATRYLTPTESRAGPKVTFRSPDSLNPRFFRLIAEAARLKVPRLRAIDAQLIPGNSGSPVLRSDGRIVGMAILVDGSQHLTFYVPAVNIRHTLRRAGVE